MKRASCLALALCLPAWPLAAQERDPTQPPAAASQPETGGANGGAASGRSMTLIVRDGRPYLVVDTRLYAQGQMVGKAKIVRITETEVTLREKRADHGVAAV